MKRLAITFLVVFTAFSSGCTTLDEPGQQPASGIATVNPGNTLATEAAKPKPPIDPRQSSQPLSRNATPPSGEQPFVVIKVDPKTGKLTGEMELRLQKVVAEARRDKRILIRMESFVPDGGSPGLDLSRSDKTLQIVRNRLVKSGISHRRILVSSFGAEHDIQRDPTRHWVEITLIKTGPKSKPASTGTIK
jgi:outer membrane protein OmpA-like peptidoglycan-associated protein